MNQENQPQTRRDVEARIIAQAWKDEAYKQELLSNPKAVIEREFEIQLPEEVKVQILEETPTSLSFVLPMRPEVPGYELNEEELEAIAGGIDWNKHRKLQMLTIVGSAFGIGALISGVGKVTQTLP